MKKFSNLVKKADTIVAFFKGITIVGEIGILIFLIMLLRMGNDFYETMEFQATLSFMEFRWAAEYVPDAQGIKILYTGTFLMAMVMLAVRYYQILILQRILKPMKEERPFDGLVAKNIRKLSWTILIGDGMFALISFGLQIWQYYALDFENLFSSDKIIEISADFKWDINFIWTFLIVYLLSYVFEYGQELQIQSDETL